MFCVKIFWSLFPSFRFSFPVTVPLSLLGFPVDRKCMNTSTCTAFLALCLFRTISWSGQTYPTNKELKSGAILSSEDGNEWGVRLIKQFFLTFIERLHLCQQGQTKGNCTGGGCHTNNHERLYIYFNHVWLYYVWKIINDILSKIRKDYLKPLVLSSHHSCGFTFPWS